MTPLKEPDPSKPVKVLMVEDNSADVFLFKEHLKQSKYPFQINVARDGEEALSLLHRSLCFPDKQDPDLILLDLNLPKMDGHQVLAEIKGDPGLKGIPVVILTSSTNEQDRTLARAGHADIYLQKPSDLENYPALVKGLEDFWSGKDA